MAHVAKDVAFSEHGFASFAGLARSGIFGKGTSQKTKEHGSVEDTKGKGEDYGAIQFIIYHWSMSMQFVLTRAQ